MNDIIKVKFNGKEYDTSIDEHGYQRFKQNSVIRYLVDSDIVNLNKLALTAMNENQFTDKDYAEFIMMLGYSVCRFCEWADSNFEEYTIENPLWDKNEE